MRKGDKYFDIAFILRGYFGKEAHDSYKREAFNLLMDFGGELDGTSKEENMDRRPAIVLTGVDGHAKGMTEAEMIAAMKSVAEKCTFKNAVERVRFWINRQEIELMPAVTAERMLFVIEWPINRVYHGSSAFVVERMEWHVRRWQATCCEVVDVAVVASPDGRAVWCSGISFPVSRTGLDRAIGSLVRAIEVAREASRVATPVEATAVVRVARCVESRSADAAALVAA